MSSPQQFLNSELGAATNMPMSSPHQSLETDRLVSSSQHSLDRELSAATDKLLLASHQAAAHAVLFTNELLCDIVGRLPFKDIISATRTCKLWRDALKDDQHMQEALFLKPTEIREVICDNHLLNDLEQPVAISDCLIIGEPHPRIGSICGEIGGEGVIMCPRPFPDFGHPDGNWRNMLIVQPPCTTVTLNTKRFGQFEKCEYQRGSGVTLGGLHDFIQLRVPKNKFYPDVWVTIPGYVFHGDVKVLWKLFTRRCDVVAGVVCRPADLPLRVESSDLESSDDSDNGNNDWDDIDEHWDRDLIESGYWDGGYDGGDFADDDLCNESMY
jgi:hypothetical protein